MEFVCSLIRASQRTGSLLQVAQLLGVQPSQVYDWIADVNLPSAERRGELQKLLRSVIQ